MKSTGILPAVALATTVQDQVPSMDNVSLPTTNNHSWILAHFGVGGGNGYSGLTICASGSYCSKINDCVQVLVHFVRIRRRYSGSLTAIRIIHNVFLALVALPQQQLLEERLLPLRRRADQADQPRRLPCQWLPAILWQAKASTPTHTTLLRSQALQYHPCRLREALLWRPRRLKWSRLVPSCGL
jgi:hypothetical protein